MKLDRIGLAIVALALASAMVGPAPASGQASGTAAGSVPSKTPWGHPDFQGIWVASEAAQPAPAPAPPPRPRPAATGSAAAASPRGGDTGAGPEHWYEAQPLIMTTQLKLVDPPDGKVPALTPDGQQRATAASGRMRARPGSFLDFSPWDRCITRGVPGSMIPINYNNNYQFLQTRDTVVIMYEMIHDARIISLNGRPRIGGSIRQWMGDARGRWDGNSLVVETTNFTDKTRVIYGDGFHSDQLRLTERFTPVAADTMRYEFTVDDPATWTKPWTAVLTLKRGKAQDRLYEYACHEGNLAMHNMLSGARADEAAEDGAKP
jgi:hypothetical protein